MISRLSRRPALAAHADRAMRSILWFSEIRNTDVPLVGGKNASLGEMFSLLKKEGILVPDGFAITASAYQTFLESGELHAFIKKQLSGISVTNVRQLASVGAAIRAKILSTPLPAALKKDILSSYKQLKKQSGNARDFSVAVRSSATAEDLPDASFAGQQETYLHVSGEDALIGAVRKCMASLFTDRAISYRAQRGYDHMAVSLSVTVQRMIASETAVSGVLFTLDTESGFQGVSLITGSYGLGEYVVKGRVVPDQFYVFKQGLAEGKRAIISRQIGSKEVQLVRAGKGTKQAVVPKKLQTQFCLTDDEVLALAKFGSIIERHYGRPQDIEWAKDGRDGKLYIVQACPETVRAGADAFQLEKYILKKTATPFLTGISIGQKIGAGPVRIVESPKDMASFKKGDVLVTRLTDPDWEPIMRIASAIITEQGGKTSHAAIVSRELGVPCLVGVSQARKKLKTGQKVTVNCAQGDEGFVYKGLLPFEVQRTVLKDIPKTKTKISMIAGDPDHAFQLSFLPHDGVGLARLEFIFTNFVRIHPLALVRYSSLKDKKAKKRIAELTKGYKTKQEYGIQKIAEGIGRIAAAMYPKQVVVRMSDFKTNEYATLIGGKEFEPHEENPMIGWRGASRYYATEYKDGFALECAAIRRVREEWGLTNVVPMIPFCRTPEEGEQVLRTMKSFGLERKKHDLKIFVMCEIPSNVILAEEYAALFDGFSIGSNDLTQLTLGVDRDSARLGSIFSEKIRRCCS